MFLWSSFSCLHSCTPLSGLCYKVISYQLTVCLPVRPPLLLEAELVDKLSVKCGPSHVILLNQAPAVQNPCKLPRASSGSCPGTLLSPCSTPPSWTWKKTSTPSDEPTVASDPHQWHPGCYQVSFSRPALFGLFQSFVQSSGHLGWGRTWRAAEQSSKYTPHCIARPHSSLAVHPPIIPLPCHALSQLYLPACLSHSTIISGAPRLPPAPWLVRGLVC